MRYCLCVCKRERKQAILLRSNSLLLCISDAPLSHDSHEVSAAAPAVSFGPAARPEPSYLSRPQLSVRIQLSLVKLTQNTEHMISVMQQGLTYSLSCGREDGRERDREGGNTRVDAADEKTITQLYNKLVLGS